VIARVVPYAALAAVALLLGGLVWAAFGRNHTRTVTVTKTVNLRYTGVASLAEFLGFPAQQGACPQGAFPAHTVCVQFNAPRFYVFAAAPAAPGSS
jgi:hypothetical protein